jgi:glycosyltransferase involved in cell wall biosynthesis
MQILLISSNYFPEPVGIGLYTADLAYILNRDGNKVTVLTTFPYYPWWKTPEHLDKYAVEHSTLDQIEVYRTQLKFNAPHKTIGRILFELRLWLGMRKVYRRVENKNFDKVVSIVPSLGAGLIARKVARSKKIDHFLIIQDITSNGVSESRMSFGTLLKYIVFPVERLIVRSANFIAVISQNMIEPIRAMAKTSTPVDLIPNYEIEAPEGLNLSRTNFNLPLDKFIVLHAGSIAHKQGLENLVRAARLSQSTNVVYYLYGHGNAENDVFQASRDLNNFFIKPPVPRDQFMSLLRCADLLIVNERSTQISMALPSKLISYFSSGVPVLAAVPKSGATYKAVEGLAFWVEAEEPESLAAAIQKIVLTAESREYYAKAAQHYFNQNLKSEKGRKRLLAWVNNSKIA